MRVVIVGGGSSGWITAATLVAGLNREGRRAIDLTVIESPDVPRIGVGEATIPTLRGLLRGLGIAEADFLSSCCGSSGRQWKSFSGPASGGLTRSIRDLATG